SLIRDLVFDISEKYGIQKDKSANSINATIEKLAVIQKNVHENPPVIAMQVLINASGLYVPGPNIKDILNKVDDITIGSNEFYSIYDLEKEKFLTVDPKVLEVLGIGSNSVTIQSLFGMDPNQRLFYEEDVDHVARWAGIAYIVLAFPGFSFKAISDHYKVNFRVAINNSINPQINEAKIIMLEKKCYLVYDDKNPSNKEPRFHFDRWTVYDASQFEYVSPVFVTNLQQGTYMNALAYLLNAFLLEVPPKYIAIMEEKRKTDRNKAVANELNKNLLNYTGIEYEFDESQIGDCFAKSIRHKMAEIMRIWDRSSKNISVLSDQEAMQCARKLGLIPVPTLVKQLLYRNILD
ncbi:MAG: hypothetical protein IT223_01615, partial [Crocinitomicaceae bacterium]|nr:hypothetical protein [Crocinitomicaceae bacterium]